MLGTNNRFFNIIFVNASNWFSTTREFYLLRPSRRRMIWFFSHPLPPPSPVSKLDLRHTGRLRKRDNLLTEGGVGEEPNHKTARKTDPLQNMPYFPSTIVIAIWGTYIVKANSNTIFGMSHVTTPLKEVPRIEKGSMQLLSKWELCTLHAAHHSESSHEKLCRTTV